jgi:lysophospholipase L1-like esterase
MGLNLNRYLKLAAAALAGALAISAPAAASSGQICAPAGPWTQSGGYAIDHGMPVGSGGAGWSNMTLREEVSVVLGGTQLRVHLSDEFASDAVTLAHVSVAQQLNGAQSAGTPVAVTFNGSTSVTMAAGAEATSDPLTYTTTPGERLLVSLFLPPTPAVQTANAHTYSQDTEYNIVGQDATMMTAPPVNNTFGFESYVAGVETNSATAQTVVAVGDSITDTGGTPIDTDTRWPDYLARRSGLAVVNEGISGNQVMADLGSGGGPSLQHRWQHDVLGVTGVRTVIDAGGINDLRAGASAAALESAQAALVASAHTAGLRVLLSTITPCAGASLCTSAFETQRLAYNAWVRAGSSGADGVADFDSAVGAGAALAGMYDDSGHIHPNAAGMLAMAGAVDVSKL